MSINGLDPKYANLKKRKFLGRVPILVTDWDGDAWIHFVALAPKRMKYEKAMQTITAEFVKVRGANDEWDYGDLEKRLKKLGFVCFTPVVWEERDDGYLPEVIKADDYE
jgi:hypothetical protein